jgi:hypothetical protein
MFFRSCTWLKARKQLLTTMHITTWEGNSCKPICNIGQNFPKIAGKKSFHRWFWNFQVQIGSIFILYWRNWEKAIGMGEIVSERMTSWHGIAKCIVGMATIFVAWSSFCYLMHLSLCSFCLKIVCYCATVRYTSSSHDYLNRKLDIGMHFFSLPNLKQGRGS